MMPTKKFTWQWENDNWKGIKIFHNDELFGHILGFYENTRSRINDKNFFIESYKPRFFVRFTYITDPQDKKSYCQVTGEGLKAPAFEYRFGEKIKKIKSTRFIKDQGEILLQMTFDRTFSPKSGTIELFTDSNQELLIYAIFYYDLMLWHASGV